MSTTVRRMFSPLPSDYFPELRRGVWGRMFGHFIQSQRNNLNMSVEQAAGLSGMEVSEWAAIEQGCVPRETSRVRAMAATLEISWDSMLNILALCQEAWTL